MNTLISGAPPLNPELCILLRRSPSELLRITVVLTVADLQLSREAFMQRYMIPALAQFGFRSQSTIDATKPRKPVTL